MSAPDDVPDEVLDDEVPDDVVELATRLFAMAREGHTDQLVAYVDAGAPVDLRNQSGDSLVMLAAYHGHDAAVAALAARGADVNLANERGQTPLAGAVFKQETAVVRALLAAGADPAAGVPSALATAEMFANDEMTALLRGDL